MSRLTAEDRFLKAVRGRNIDVVNRLLDENRELLWDDHFRDKFTSEDLLWILGVRERPA